MMRFSLLFALLALLLPLPPLPAQEAPVHLARYGAGAGPAPIDDGFRLLDAARTPGQSNAIAFECTTKGAFEQVTVTCKMRVLRGGDGGSFIFLDTKAHGATGPAPFLPSWVEPNLADTFAVGIDVHDPPNSEPFGPWGNYQGQPEREVSLHWDGREIVKRVAPAKFRGDIADVEIMVRHVVGGADVSVTIAGAAVYDRHFVAGMLPYESRLAIGAGTRTDVTTEFDVTGIEFRAAEPAKPRRPPLHVEVFHHVMTDNSKTSFRSEVELPPARWAFGRVILTLDIHDGGKMWDEWDRNGHLEVVGADGTRYDIVPFITSYRTPCHWEVDVTHFRPLLSGKVTFEIAAGTTFYKNRGYLMSVALDFYHGELDPEPVAVVPVWVGTAHYRSHENHFQDFFVPRTIAIPEETVAAQLFLATTGHSQVGEFTPSLRTVVFAPAKDGDPSEEQRFTNTLWKSDCYLNPNRPQYGTWKYARAGWAPGDVVRPWWIDLTPHLVPGREAQLRYEPEPYDFGGATKPPTEKQLAAAQQVIRSYLIHYRKPSGLVAAPILVIRSVAEGSNAALAGLQGGDYLAEYDGHRIDSVEDLRAAIMAAMEANKEMAKVVVWRGTERLEVEMPPGRMGVSLGSR